MLLTIHGPDLKKVAILDNDKTGTLNYFNDTWYRNLETASSTFDFSIFKKALETDIGLKRSYNYLNEKAYVSFKYKGKTYLHTIRKVEENEKIIKVNGINLNLELINEYANPYKATKAMTFKEYCNAMDLLNFTFLKIGINEISAQKISTEWEGTDTKLNRLLSLAKKFGAEIEFDTHLNADSTIKAFIVNVYHEHDENHHGVGRSHTKRLTYGKDLKTISRTVDKTNIYNAVRPTGRTENGDVVTIAGLSDWSVKNEKGEREFYQNGELLYAPLSMQMFPSAFTSNTTNDQWIRKDMQVDSANPEVIRSAAYRELKKDAYPAVSYEAKGYFEGDIGDTVEVYDDGFSPVLLLEMRITEQYISFTNPSNSKTVFDNFKAIENKLSQGIQTRLDQMLEEAKPYIIKLATDNGVIFKNRSGQTIVTPTLYKGGKVISNDVTWRWKFNNEMSVGASKTIRASSFGQTAILTVAAYIGNDEVAVNEISFVNVSDGAKGEDGKTQYTHIAYAQKSTSHPYNRVVNRDTPSGHQGAVIRKDGVSYTSTGGTNVTKLPVSFYGTSGKSAWMYFKIKNTHATNPLIIRFNGFGPTVGASYPAIRLAPGETRTYMQSGYARSTYDYFQVNFLAAEITHDLAWDIYELDFYDGPPFVNFSQDSLNATHIGMYVDDQEQDSTDISSYNWTLIKGNDGEQGVPGPPGTDGRTPYFHTAYANSADGRLDFSTTVSDDKRYIGTYTDYTEADSTDPTKYKWVDMAAPAEDVVKKQAVLKTDISITDEGIVHSASKTVNGQTIASMIAQRAEWVEIIAKLLKVKGDMLVNGSITADKINVSKLSAIIADLGNITGGSLTLSKVIEAGSGTNTSEDTSGGVSASPTRLHPYTYPEHTIQMMLDNSGFTILGKLFAKTLSETVAKNRTVTKLNEEGVSFTIDDSTGTGARLRPVWSAQDQQYDLLVESDGDVVLSGNNYTDWVSTGVSGCYYMIQGRTVSLKFEVKTTANRAFELGRIPAHLVPQDFMRIVQAWANNSQQRTLQIGSDGSAYLLSNPIANTFKCIETWNF